MKNVRKNHEKRRNANMKNAVKNIIKNILLFVVTAAAGFGAMSLPFRLFDELSQTEMRLVLAAELAVLAIVFSAVFLSKEAREQKKLRSTRSSMPESERILQQGAESNDGYYNDDYNFAA